MSEFIIKHAVEEEARLMRVIMQKAKEESLDSIKDNARTQLGC